MRNVLIGLGVMAALAACAPAAANEDDPEQTIRRAIQTNNPRGMPQYCERINHYGMDYSIQWTEEYHKTHQKPWNEHYPTAMQNIYNEEC
jgi:hypothetical protein